MKKVVLILGTGHCGSTLLDLILSSHSSSFGVGELRDIKDNEKYITRELPPNKLFGYEDNLWTPDRLRRVYRSFAVENTLLYRIKMRLVPKLLNNRIAIYKDIFSGMEDKTMMVDSSKSAFYITNSIRQLSESTDLDPYLIWIRRDPRAVINSLRRKYPDVPVGDFIDNFKTSDEKALMLYSSTLASKMIVRYEELAANPVCEVKRVCELLDVCFEKSMLDYWKRKHHHIGGNSGTLSLVAKYHNDLQSPLNTDNHHKGYYNNHGFEIKPDDRWKKELGIEDVRCINEAFQIK